MFPVPRPFQAYEKRLRVRDIERYRRERLLLGRGRQPPEGAGPQGGPAQRPRYYAALDAASAETDTFSPVRRRAPKPVAFSYDKSFNYQPRAFERPGPVVEIHRLSDCTPAVR